MLGWAGEGRQTRLRPQDLTTPHTFVPATCRTCLRRCLPPHTCLPAMPGGGGGEEEAWLASHFVFEASTVSCVVGDVLMMDDVEKNGHQSQFI